MLNRFKHFDNDELLKEYEDVSEHIKEIKSELTKNSDNRYCKAELTYLRGYKKEIQVEIELRGLNVQYR